MATTKPTAAQVAKLRRQGATWAQVRAETGLRGSSTRLGKLLAEGGYGYDGLKLDGSGTRSSKARTMPAATRKRMSSARRKPKQAKPSARMTAKAAAEQMLSYRPTADFAALKRSMAGKSPAERRKALAAERERASK